MNKTSILCSALAIAALAAGPSLAADLTNTSMVVASVTTVHHTPDPVVQKALELITESQRAQEQKQRHDSMQQSDQDRVVESTPRKHRDLDKALILGGGAALPM